MFNGVNGRTVRGDSGAAISVKRQRGDGEEANAAAAAVPEAAQLLQALPEPSPDDPALRCFNPGNGELNLQCLVEPREFLQKDREQFDSFNARVVATHGRGIAAINLSPDTPEHVRLSWQAMLRDTGIAVRAARGETPAEVGNTAADSSGVPLASRRLAQAGEQPRVFPKLPHALEAMSLGFLSLRELGQSAATSSHWDAAAAGATDRQSRLDAETHGEPMKRLGQVAAHEFCRPDVLALLSRMGWRAEGGSQHCWHRQLAIHSSVLLAAAMKREAGSYALLEGAETGEFDMSDVSLSVELRALVESEGFGFSMRLGGGCGLIGLNSGRLVAFQNAGAERVNIQWPPGFEPIRQIFPTTEGLHVMGNMGGCARLTEQWGRDLNGNNVRQIHLNVIPLPAGRTMEGFVGGAVDDTAVLMDNGCALTDRGQVPEGARVVQASLNLDHRLPHHLLRDDGHVIEQGPKSELEAQDAACRYKDISAPGRPVCLVSADFLKFGCITHDEESSSLFIYVEPWSGPRLLRQADATLCLLTAQGEDDGRPIPLFPQLDGSCISLRRGIGFTVHAPGTWPGLQIRHRVPPHLALQRPWVSSDHLLQVRSLEAAHRAQGLQYIGDTARVVRFAATAAVPALEEFTTPPRQAGEWLYSVPQERLQALASVAGMPRGG